MAGHVSASAQRGVERRAHILDAALELFAEQGFTLTSLPSDCPAGRYYSCRDPSPLRLERGSALLEREGPVPHFSAETVGVPVSLPEKKTSA